MLGALCKTPPPPGIIPYLTVIMGKMSDSRHNPGLDGEAILGVLPNDSSEIKRPFPFPRSGLIIGDFHNLSRLGESDVSGPASCRFRSAKGQADF